LSIVLISIFCISCNSVKNKNVKNEEPYNNDDPVVVYSLSGMEDVIVKMDIPYREHGDSNLVMDIYYPPNFKFELKVPAIVIVFGYTDEAQNKIVGNQFRKLSWYTSWCRIIAASGMAAIAYETIDPVDDLVAIEMFIKENEEDLLISKDRIGAFAVSANTPAAISRLLDASNEFFKCGVFYYGFVLTHNSKYLSPIDSLSKHMGFSTPRLADDINLNLNAPMMLIRAGMDNVPYLNQTLNEFLNLAQKNNLPVTLINYPNGVHGFDAFNDNDTTRMIIESTIEFWRFYLFNSNSN